LRFDKVSIGLPTYNCKDLISDVFLSILQMGESGEIIVVDDCSTDGTWEILNEIKKSSESIKLFRNTKNLGVAGTRNRIISEASCEFLMFCDDDDLQNPERLKLQLEFMCDAEEEYGSEALIICHTNRMMISLDGKFIAYQRGLSSSGGVVVGSDVWKYILFGEKKSQIDGTVATCTQMARLGTYKQLQGFDRRFRRSEDTEFAIRAAAKGAIFGLCDRSLVDQVITEGPDKNLCLEEQYFVRLVIAHRELVRLEYNDTFLVHFLHMKYSIKQHQFVRASKHACVALMASPRLFLTRLAYAFYASIYSR